LCIWQRNKQKGIKNGMKNDVKNGYREHPGKGNFKNGAKLHFSFQAHWQKNEK
jgi:hypothetical protein